jgi:hypothetical protein
MERMLPLRVPCKFYDYVSLRVLPAVGVLGVVSKFKTYKRCE